MDDHIDSGDVQMTETLSMSVGQDKESRVDPRRLRNIKELCSNI